MKKKRAKLDIFAKANRILQIILVGIILIALRVWHLAIIQHDERLAESKRPQKRVVIEPAKRGTIRDRFNLPLAINKIQYNAAILYAEIRQIPSVKWEVINGKKVKTYQRREYILKLSQLMGNELNLDPERIEDLIHSQAALYNHLPYVIKNDISESQYYKLKMLEKDWLGIKMQCVPKRYYPLGKVGADLIGFMGAISKGEYENIIQEIKTLENALSEQEDLEDREQKEKRLRDLIEHAYAISDDVGKAGIEGQFEEVLRGYHGKKSYFSDARGNFIKQLPEKKLPRSGKRVLLTISAELQEFAEKLLIQNERIRKPRVTSLNNTDNKSYAKNHPWIKGGTIIAMDPHTGDIYAMASFPRFDPNDFLRSGSADVQREKNARIHRWFETESYLGQIWEEKRPLEREFYNLQSGQIEEEKILLDWETYLNFVLPEKSAVKESLKKIKNVQEAIILQDHIDKLLSIFDDPPLYTLFNLLYPAPHHEPHGHRLPAVQQEALEETLVANQAAAMDIKAVLDPVIADLLSNYDKVLLLDLVRLVIDNKRVTEAAYPLLHDMTLSTYKKNNIAFLQVEQFAKKIVKNLYRKNVFLPWRRENQKAFLKEKRREEVARQQKYGKPYLVLLDRKEDEMFKDFWQNNALNILHVFLTAKLPKEDTELAPYSQEMQCLADELSNDSAYCTLRKTFEGISKETAIALMHSFRRFCELDRPLLGRYAHISREKSVQLEKHLASAFYPLYGHGYGRSYSYRQAATQGSLFKIVTSYAALIQKYQKIQGPLSNTSALNPFDMTDDTHKSAGMTYVGYDNRGQPIAQHYKGGRIPRSHRSGIGKIDLLRAFEVSSNPYFSLLAIDHLENPNDLSLAAAEFSFGSKTGIDLPAEISGNVPQDIDCNRTGLYAMAIGQHSLVVTPLQTAVMLASIANGGNILKPKIVNMIVGKKDDAISQVLLNSTEVKRQILLPIEVKQMLLEGMRLVAKKSLSTGFESLSKLYESYPEALGDLISMNNELLGKSSTSESVEKSNLGQHEGTNIYNHIWFGGIVYSSEEGMPKTFVSCDRFGNPELVVVVYLRYGSWGKETIPLAAQIAKKWREIKEKHRENLL